MGRCLILFYYLKQAMDARDASVYRIIVVVLCLIILVVSIPNIIFYSNGQAQNINVVYAIFMLVANALMVILALCVLIYVIVRSQSTPRSGPSGTTPSPASTMYVPYSPTFGSPVTFG